MAKSLISSLSKVDTGHGTSVLQSDRCYKPAWLQWDALAAPVFPPLTGIEDLLLMARCWRDYCMLEAAIAFMGRK